MRPVIRAVSKFPARIWLRFGVAGFRLQRFPSRSGIQSMSFANALKALAFPVGIPPMIGVMRLCWLAHLLLLRRLRLRVIIPLPVLIM
jgi:hypothetical protein